MNTVPRSKALHEPAVDGADMDGSRLSALLDGELAADELEALFLAPDESVGLNSAWASYQVIGACLRGTDAALGLKAPQAFLDGVHAGLRGTAEQYEVDEDEVRGTLRLADAPMPRAAGSALAANDPVFRWKLVAGLASMAAVMAISWTVLGASRAGSGSGGSQLALVQSVPDQGNTVPAEAVDAPLSGGPSQAVVVNTDRGPLIRDARLEALMAEHRHGGVSALQMPAGFLRNATYEGAGR